ncbi:MAG: hypothetical protein JWN12_389 [Candidatus Saccharibacteria bacterium]|nr:hypothetical protein [Candidatus Saccharibacteria bacterium]
MSILKVVRDRAAYFIAAVVLSVAVIVPGLVSAAQVTQRSIGLSSSSAGASNVTYQVKFTVPGSSVGGGAFGIIFCSNSPDTATACTAPTGFVTTGAASTTSGFTTVTTPTANSVVVAGTIAASANISVDINGITNPTAAGPVYARIATYVDASAATADTAGTAGVDNGGVAISITPTIGVSGAVLESMTFCVANVTITANCGDAASHLPVLTLGETVGSTKALTTTAVSTGVLYTQISTNAATGAVVYLKSATDCGGLKRVGAAACDIAPALTAGITAGDALFGVKTGTASGTGSNPNGTIRPAGSYNGSTYTFNYLANNTTGVTSPIGDAFLDTNSLPANNQNMDLTFGASVSNSTPAGNYSTSLSMIATGKF